VVSRLSPHFEAALAGFDAWRVRSLGLALCAASALVGCSSASDHPGAATHAEPSAGGAAASAPGVTVGGVPGTSQGMLDGCAYVGQTAVSTYRPIDVIFAVDNSPSMADEIGQVQARINQDFAQIMADSGLDYRVILISRYGQVGVPVGASANPMCIGAPLGNGGCEDPMSTRLSNGERFFQFSAAVGSHDAWCVLLGGFNQPDEFGDSPRAGWTPLAQHGYEEYLRKEAFKVFVVVTDDDASCKFEGQTFEDGVTVGGGERAAADFDAALLTLSPEQFGTTAKRNYVFHSIVGLAENTPSPTVLPASAPMQMGRCAAGSEGPGTGYQALSRLTGGLRYPSCESQNFDSLFNTIASGIVADAEMNCAWQIPAPPAGQSFDSSRVNVRFTSGRGVVEDIRSVPDASHCSNSGGWYYDDALSPTEVRACPSTCDHIRPDSRGRIDVLFGCQTQTFIR
jgi:hypothetical protein